MVSQSFFRSISIFLRIEFIWCVSLFSSKMFILPKANKNRYTSQSTLHRKIRGNTGTCTNSLEHRNVLEQVSPRVLCKHYRVDVPRHTNSSFLNNNSFRLNHSTVYIPNTINQLEYPSYLWAFFIYYK